MALPPPPAEPPTPEWRKALRDLASITAGTFLLVNEALADVPNEPRMYVGALLLVGPVGLRALGR